MKKFVISCLMLCAASLSFAQSTMGEMKGIDMTKKPAAGG